MFLLSLTRYVHLNPVFIAVVKKLPLEQCLARLNSYRWSSYGGYIDQSKALGFVDYSPVLAIIDARGRKIASGKYRKFVAAKMLCKFAGLTQREVAGILNLGSGAAVSCQLRKLQRSAQENYEVKNLIGKLTAKLESQLNEHPIGYNFLKILL